MRKIKEEHVSSLAELLKMVGEDPQRQGLQETPRRMAKAWLDLTKGYEVDVAELLSKRFAMDDSEVGVKYNGMVLVRDIEVHSVCEHHFLPFMGRAHVGYIPGKDGAVLGVSKLARLVDAYARRLQCQERLTAQIADALVEYGDAQGVIVVIDAAHMCMRMRGVSKQNSSMITSEVRGLFKSDAQARTEALSLLKGPGR